DAGGAARPARAPGAPQARLLDPRRSLAARRAGAVRPRDALGGDSPAPGLLPTRGRPAPDRRPQRGPRRPEPPALGPARLHALARAACRAHARPAARAQGRSARPVKVWIDIS